MTSRLLRRAMLTLCVVLTGAQTLKFAGLIPQNAKTGLVDFEAFYIAGQMVWRGGIDSAYEFTQLMQAQKLYASGLQLFMPWTYPPPYNLFVAMLSLLPIWGAYLVFVSATLGFYLIVLRKLAGEHLTFVLLAVFPSFLITIASGQNGFLTGGLIGLACIFIKQSRQQGGVPLGLMIIKPHLAIGLGLFTLATRAWVTAAWAVAVAGALLAISTMQFGAGIWPAFVKGVGEASDFLSAGRYPLHRMISVYAGFRSLGAPAAAAMLAQLIAVLLALGAVVAAARSRLPIEAKVATAAMASLFMTPYSYDYDLPVLGVSLALLAPVLLTGLTTRQIVLLLILTWTMSFWGVAAGMWAIFSHGGGQALSEARMTTTSLGGFCLAATAWLVLSALRATGATPTAGKRQKTIETGS